MKNQRIRERREALVVLSRRVLPGKTTINKVTVLLRHYFEEPFQTTEILRKRMVFEDHPLPDGYDGDRLPALLAEQRQKAADQLMALKTPVRKIPDRLRLTYDDMPKPLKGEDGWRNAEGLGDIIMNLGSLFVPDAEETKLAEREDGFEDDDEEIESIAPADSLSEHEADG